MAWYCNTSLSWASRVICCNNHLSLVLNGAERYLSDLENLENMEPWDSSPKMRNLSSFFYPHVILLKLFTLFCEKREVLKNINDVIFVHTVKVDGDMYQNVCFCVRNIMKIQLKILSVCYLGKFQLKWSKESKHIDIVFRFQSFQSELFLKKLKLVAIFSISKHSVCAIH